MAGKFRDALRAHEYETPVSTNMLLEFVKDCQYLGYEFAKVNFVNHFADDERAPAMLVVSTFEADLLAEVAKLDRFTPYGDPYFNDQGEYGVDWSYEDEEG
jgi:hypothetical protein